MKTMKINQVIFLEDKNLQSEIKSLLNKTNNTITLKDMLKLRVLDLSNKDIKSLKGLEYASNLYTLILDGTYVTDLQYVPSSVNYISSKNLKEEVNIPDDRLKSLINVILGKNDKCILTFNDIKTLTVLDEFSNHIKSLEGLQYAENLKILSLLNNKISDISVLENRRVQELAINNNPITNIDLSKNYSYEINIDTEQQKYIKNYEDNWTSINIVLDPIKEVGTSIKIKNPIEYVSMDKVTFENAIYNAEDNTLFIDNIDSTSMNEISITYWRGSNTYGQIIIPIEREPELDEEINVEIPEHIKDIIDTTIVTPVSGNGLKENPLILEAKEVSVDKVKELVNSFDKANVVCETIENDGTYTKYKFKLVNSITRSLDETYFTIIVANSQIDIINLLNNHYEIKNDDTNNGNDNDKDNSNNSSSAGGSGGTDESDGNGGATEDNLNKNEGTTNDSIIVKPENNTNQDANNKVESNISKLPVTGQAVASSLFVAFGTFLTGVGTFISRKKKDNK